jgi:protein-disulfide isomerase
MKFTRIFTAIAITGGLAFGAAAYADSDFSAGQKKQIETIVHDYLLKKPEVIAEAVQSLQQKQVEQMKSKGQEAAKKNANQLFKQTNDPVSGNVNGKISVVEFFDYQCPHCVDMVPDIQAIIKANPDVRVVYKEFPIRGPVSLVASKAALAANKQGKYNELHEALMNSAKSLTEAKIMELASSVGLDVKKLKADMDGKEIDEQVKANYKLAQELQLYGTPALFIAKSDLPQDSSAVVIDFIPGQVDQKGLQESIDKITR